MTTVDRRTILASGALALAGTATQTVQAQAQAGPKPIFPVPATTIPIVGETDVFQVRRIYCIGRNYAAHSRGDVLLCKLEGLPDMSIRIT
jgi:fumarylpyruvate hydrolase